MKLYATIGVGMEAVASRELTALGITPGRVEPGRVRFEGSLTDLYRGLIHLRTVSRIVREIAFAEVHSENDIYETVRAIDWPALFSNNKSFRIRLNAHSSLLQNTHFGLYRIKDAICDCFVDATGSRPDVNTQYPDVFLYCYLENRRFSVGLDGAGDPLHMRGYRVVGHSASLREHLAAAMVLHSNWDTERPLYDPFCGSGTIPIEAAMIATKTPPSLWRTRFGCESWLDFDSQAFQDLREEARAQTVACPGLRVWGGDIDEATCASALKNVAAAGMQSHVTIAHQPVMALSAQPNSHIVSNPPYGVRLGDEAEIAAAMRDFRERVLSCPGAHVAVLSASDDFERLFSLRPFKKNRMSNGGIRCTLYQYKINAP